MNSAQKQASFRNNRGQTGVDLKSPGISTVIVGLGQPYRGDDGAGNAVVNRLAQTRGLPQNINIMEGGTSALFDAILSNKYERVILIDAAEIGRQPGEWICLNSEQATGTPNNRDCAEDGHQLNPGNLLALGRVLGVLPREMLIYAVQPLSLEWTGNLSLPVRKAVSEISESILREIGSETREPGNLDRNGSLLEPVSRVDPRSMDH
jgi:hydrogenase maturation protease